MVKQYHAGYVIESAFKALLSKDRKSGLVAYDLLRSLSCFTIDTDIEELEPREQCDPTLLVMSNLISRGQPTRPSMYVENEFAGAMRSKLQTSATGLLEYRLTEESDAIVGSYLDALHVIEPRFPAKDAYEHLQPGWENLHPAYERGFFYEDLPRLFGSDAIVQLLKPQRGMETIVGRKADFTHQRVDFACEFPLKIDGTAGIVIEVDGSQHEEPAQQALDVRRDQAIMDAGWMPTIRLRTSDWPPTHASLDRFIRLRTEPCFATLLKNYDRGLSDPDWRRALTIALSPLAMARVQKVLVELMISGVLSLEAESWKLTVIERDVPCAAMAVLDLRITLNRLWRMRGSSRRLPRIHLEVLRTQDFSNTILPDPFAKVRRVDDRERVSQCDVLVDVSMLQRHGLRLLESHVDFAHYVTIRTSHARIEKQKYHCGDLISYDPIAVQTADGNWNILRKRRQLPELLLRDLFRMKQFRLGQIEILNRALQGETVIGLLPTGGGKSLTYQYAALMQPGVVIIVDPLISLMSDQYDGLRKNWIHAGVFINSTMTPGERRKVTSEFTEGLHLMCFLSPERLTMESFRQSLATMPEHGTYFSYVVIDEVHCVSEWGHDFRTSYLQLGSNAMRYCLTKSGKTVPLFGLTATASFDVLSDVQRELGGMEDGDLLPENAVIRSLQVHRPELTYRVVSANHLQVHGIADKRAYRTAVGLSKQSVLSRLLATAQTTYTERYGTNVAPHQRGNGSTDEGVVAAYPPTIIFCPHRGDVFGVMNQPNPNNQPQNPAVIDSVPTGLNTGWFMGANGDGGAGNFAKQALSNQKAFVKGGLDVMVATKAFGMGIDKPDVRFTYHINYPQSLESFVQEAGRAGRDRNPALCTILLHEPNNNVPHAFDVDYELMEFFHDNAFLGPDREIRILFDLLSRIELPSLQGSYAVGKRIKELWERDIDVRVWAGGNNRRLYLNDVSGTLGRIGYVNISVNYPYIVDAGTADPATAKGLLHTAGDYIRTTWQNPDEAWRQLNASIPQRANPGIEQILENLSEATSARVVIGFTNDPHRVKREIAALLQNNFNIHLNDAQVASIALEGWSKVVQSICRAVNSRQHYNAINNNAALKTVYEGYRSPAQTGKAMYRLTAAGLISGYSVDYASETYTATVVKRQDRGYLDHVRRYIRQYYSENRTNAIMQTIEEGGQPNIYRRVLDFLVKFIYKEIAEKRKASISAMREACHEGLKQNGEQAFAEFVDLYFNSRYARREYLPTDTNDGKDHPLEVVWKYTRLIENDPRGGAIIDNLKNLRGACVKMMVDAPMNPVLHLLKAFAQLILESSNAHLVEDSMNNIAFGLKGFISDETIPLDERLGIMNRFKEEVMRHTSDTRVLAPIDEFLYYSEIVYHTQWLTSFNKQIGG